jgi:hypothetical protein
MLELKDVINELKEIHNNKYEYLELFHENGHLKIKVVCPEHGEFTQRYQHHKNGHGCKKCSGVQPHTTDTFVSLANSIHKNKYNYSKSEYKNAKTKVCIICPKHGEFWQSPTNHISGKK